MPELTVGQKAPLFSLPSHTGETIKLKDYSGPDGKNVVLYFYPHDDTPGCTTEACDFRDNLGQFQSAGTVVLGISTDDLKSHQKFAQKFSLTFPLLADVDHVVAEKYGVWGEKSNFGKKYMGIRRTTFLIDKQGKIAALWLNVRVAGHALKVAEQLSQLASK